VGYIIDGYTVKSGSKDMWFIYEDTFPNIEVYFCNVRLKPRMLKKLRDNALDGSLIQFSSDGISFIAAMCRIESSSKRKFNFMLKSTGELKYEHTNTQD
jgi:hypothetical protein